MIEIVVKCHCCGDEFTLEVKEEDFMEYMFSSPRRHIQDIFPYLKPSERELLISNTCDKCFHEMFG